MNNKFIVSAIDPSNKGGTGRFLKHLIDLKSECNLIIKWKYKACLKHNVKNKHLFQSFKTLIKHIWSVSKFYIFCTFSSGKDLIVLHPQSIGFSLFLRLIKRNKVHWYILDNSFFCLKSYNYRKDIGECTDCLSNVDNCHASCFPFPIKINKKKNLIYLHKISNNLSNISFYCQNASQEKMLKLHFGSDIKSKVIGMNTGEADSAEVDDTNNLVNSDYSIVYHGSKNEAKGIKYFLELTKKLPEAEFIIPYKKSSIEDLLPLSIKNNNIMFIECSWETGLEKLIRNCYLVLCPSLWSSCVEGSVLKSLKYGKNVGMVKNDFGYVNDLPNDILLKLSLDTHEAAKQIITHRNNSVNFKEKANKWLDDYTKETNYNLVKKLLDE